MSPRKLSDRISFGGVRDAGGAIVSVHVLVDGKPWPLPLDQAPVLEGCDADEQAVTMAIWADEMIAQGLIPAPASAANPAPEEPLPVGVKHSLERIRQLAQQGTNNAYVRAWGVRQLAAAGNPTGQAERARVLLDAIRRENIWVPDPVAEPPRDPGPLPRVRPDWDKLDGPRWPEPRAQHRYLRYLPDSPVTAGDCDPFAMTGNAELDALLRNTRAQLDAAMRAGNLGAARKAMAIALAAQQGGAQVVGEAYKPDGQLQHVVAGIVGIDGQLRVIDPCAVTRRQEIAARIAIRHSAAPDGALQFEVLADGKRMHMPKYVMWYLGQLPVAERQPFVVDLLLEAEERDTVDGAYRPDPMASELSDPGPLEQEALDAWLAHLAAKRTAEAMANPIVLGAGEGEKGGNDG